MKMNHTNYSEKVEGNDGNHLTGKGPAEKMTIIAYGALSGTASWV
jgi:hypothetical protein